MKKSIVAVAIMLFAYSAFAQNTGTLLNNYISIKNALVQGDNKAATQAITVFYNAVKAEKDFAKKADLVKATEKLNKATDLKSQRDAFNDVSTTMWAVVKNSDKINQPVYYQYCPMKEGYWLSNEKEIKNPYYGSAMLACGKVVESKM